MTPAQQNVSGDQEAGCTARPAAPGWGGGGGGGGCYRPVSIAVGDMWALKPFLTFCQRVMSFLSWVSYLDRPILIYLFPGSAVSAI